MLCDGSLDLCTHFLAKPQPCLAPSSRNPGFLQKKAPRQLSLPSCLPLDRSPMPASSSAGPCGGPGRPGAWERVGQTHHRISCCISVAPGEGAWGGGPVEGGSHSLPWALKPAAPHLADAQGGVVPPGLGGRGAGASGWGCVCPQQTRFGYLPLDKPKGRERSGGEARRALM